MPLYIVEITHFAVVVAYDRRHAEKVAGQFVSDVVSDAADPDECITQSEVRDASVLSGGWDEECLPYGGDGKRRIREYIAEGAHNG